MARSTRLRDGVSGILLAAALALLVAGAASADVLPEPTFSEQLTPEADRSTRAYADSASDSAASALELAVVFAIPLGLTLLVEVPVVGIASRWDRRAVAAGVLVNTLTNPLLVLTVVAAGRLVPSQPGSVWPLAGLAVLELGVVVAEWKLYRWALGWPERRAFVTSLAANVLSFGVGIALGYTAL